MSVILRPGRAAIRFSGPDAHRLLNDVLTGPFREGADAGWWALLTAQGKMEAEGLSGYAGGGWWLDLHETVADAFLRRMKMYKLRARAEIEDLRATHRVGWSPDAPAAAEGRIVHADRRGDGLGHRVIAPLEDAAGWGISEDFLAARISAGIAELGEDFAPGAVFAHDIGMDLNGGIDFSKGCFVGQEVVSRMKHRGTARRRPVLVSGLAEGAGTGAPVLVGPREAGRIGRALGGRAVGIVRLDRVPASDAAEVEGAPVTLALPHWAGYAFGESGPDE